MVTQLTVELEKVFGSLSKTLLFEYQTIEALTGYFIDAHRAQLSSLLNLEPRATGALPVVAEAVTATWPDPLALGSRRRQRSRFAASTPALPGKMVVENEDIAIIGMAGRYPQARDLERSGRTCAAGRDCITEIPAERWDHGRYFDAETAASAGKTYSKWGGFIDGVDQFDPLFFNISPREARDDGPAGAAVPADAWTRRWKTPATRASSCRSAAGSWTAASASSSA